MARAQRELESEEKVTPYDQFNMEISQDNFPAKGMAARAAQAIVQSYAWTDANPMLNLSSFVTTYAEPEAVELARAHFTKNYIDHDMYPQVFVMETWMVRLLHDLWNGPKDVEPYGTATIGSSEACMLAGLAHKWNWRERQEKAGKDASKPNMVTGGNVQIVWKKFLRYFDVEPRIVPLKPGNYRLTAEHLDKYVDENTICVVAIAGQTFTGEDDDIQEIHDWLDAYEQETGISIPMHIDGASGRIRESRSSIRNTSGISDCRACFPLTPRGTSLVSCRRDSAGSSSESARSSTKTWCSMSTISVARCPPRP